MEITIGNKVQADAEVAAAIFFETCGLTAERVLIDRGQFVVTCGMVKFTFDQDRVEEWREELKRDAVAGDFL